MVPLSTPTKAVFRALLAALATTVALSGCTSQSRSQSDIALSRAEWRAEIASYPAETFTQAGLQAHYANATTLDDSAAHGTQIAHLAADGAVYLWYPGNQRIVTGRWQTRDPVDGSAFAQICFLYGRETFNPATQSFGGTFDCVNAGLFVIYEDAYTQGDPFDLASGKLPYVLSKDRAYTLEQARAVSSR